LLTLDDLADPRKCCVTFAQLKVEMDEPVPTSNSNQMIQIIETTRRICTNSEIQAGITLNHPGLAMDFLDTSL
jgi:hypothetical protein